MGQESSSPPCVFLSADIGRRLFPEFFAGKTAALAAARGEEIRTKCGLLRTRYVRLRDLSQRALLPRPALRGERVGVSDYLGSQAALAYSARASRALALRRTSNLPASAIRMTIFSFLAATNLARNSPRLWS